MGSAYFAWAAASFQRYPTSRQSPCAFSACCWACFTLSQLTAHCASCAACVSRATPHFCRISTHFTRSLQVLPSCCIFPQTGAFFSEPLPTGAAHTTRTTSLLASPCLKMCLEQTRRPPMGSKLPDARLCCGVIFPRPAGHGGARRGLCHLLPPYTHGPRGSSQTSHPAGIAGGEQSGT